jgi:hypothetical protein
MAAPSPLVAELLLNFHDKELLLSGTAAHLPTVIMIRITDIS